MRNVEFHRAEIGRTNSKRAVLILSLLVGVCILFRPVFLWAREQIGDPGPGLTASLDQDSVRVGSVIVLTLKYRLPEGARLPEKPEIKGLEGLTMLARVMAPCHITIKLLVDRIGSWETGTLTVDYLDKDGETRKLTTDPVSLTVLSNLGEKPEEAQLRPIQGIIPTKALWLKVLPWAAGLLTIFLALGACVWLYRRRRARIAHVEVQDPPHIVAFKEIEQLESSGLSENGLVKEYYFLLSEILRRYLEALRQFPAAECTTEEIARYLDNEQDRKLLPLLRHADLVKFADSIPTPARREEDLGKVISYIRETGPAEDLGGAEAGSPEAPR